jgi:hypothetical protein
VGKRQSEAPIGVGGVSHQVAECTTEVEVGSGTLASGAQASGAGGKRLVEASRESGHVQKRLGCEGPFGDWNARVEMARIQATGDDLVAGIESPDFAARDATPGESPARRAQTTVGELDSGVCAPLWARIQLACRLEGRQQR